MIDISNRTADSPRAHRAGPGRALTGWLVVALVLLATACDASEKRMVEQLNRGTDALARGSYLEAKVAFDKAQALVPDDADVRYYLGFLALRDGDPKAALAHLTVSAVGDPQRPDVHLGLARAYERLQQPKEALAALHKLFAIDPGHPNGHLLAARIAQAVGDREAANAALRAAIAGDPGFAPAYLMLSQLYAEVGAWQPARDVLTEGLRFSPDVVELQEALGMAWLDLGRPDHAKAVYTAAAKDPRASASLHFNFASALLQLGESDAAYDELRRFLVIGRGTGASEALMQVGARMALRLRRAKKAAAAVRPSSAGAPPAL